MPPSIEIDSSILPLLYDHTHGSTQDGGNSSANALELPQSCA